MTPAGVHAGAAPVKRFVERLAHAWKVNDSLVCVGLDPEPERFPAHLARGAAAIFEFNRAIIDYSAAD